MKTIGIIGANGQVGSEVCLFLSLRPDIRVVPISRSVYGSTLLRHCGLDVRHGSLKSAEDARRLTEDCDLVADFSAPHGRPLDVRKIISVNITNAIANSPVGAQYVYISTHNVFRHTTKQPRYRSYARIKLSGEKLAFEAGLANNKEVYVLRLGQVHGLLQGISHEYLADMRHEEAVLPNLPSLVVFVYSIAEALVNIANQKEAAGTYMLTSVPAWRPEEVHAYYCGLAGVEPRSRTEDVHTATIRQSVTRVLRATAEPIWHEVFGERELIDDLLSNYAPTTAIRLRSDYYVKRAAAEFALRGAAAWRPIDQDFDAPGVRLSSLSDSRMTMHEPTRAVSELLNGSLERRLTPTQELVYR